MTSRGRMLAEMGRSAYELQLQGEPSWVVPRDEVGVVDLGDQEEAESDADSDHPDHNTDSEQSHEEVSDAEGISDAGDMSDPYENDDPSNCFVGKDNITIWHANPPRKNVRTAKKNIVLRLPGVKSVAKNAKTPIDCWKLFFPNSMVEKILLNTNRWLEKVRGNYTRERDCRETSLAEIHALFGLLYMAGLKKAQHLNVKELWDTDGTAPPCFRATMSRERFLLLLRALRFDNFDDRAPRKAVDNLAPIREIFEEFLTKSKENYQVGEYTTIDEMLEPFRGRCKFRQYIPSKPAKYGVKIYALVDARTFYTSNMEIYAGRQPNGPYCLPNAASEVVKRLAHHILDTGRNITMDNFFTSIPLGEELLKRRTTIVGTLRKNKKEIPPKFVETKKRALHSSLFGFKKDGLLISYKTKPSSVVLLHSTFHDDDSIDERTGDFRKPEAITFYNSTKGGVDVVDEMKSLYSVARVSCRWPLTVFFGLMDTGGINAQIIYKANSGNLIERRSFLKELALSLMKEHLISRSSLQHLSIHDRTTIRTIIGIEYNDETPEYNNPPGFCKFCPRRKNRKTKKVCAKCEAPICQSHIVFSCVECGEARPDE